MAIKPATCIFKKRIFVTWKLSRLFLCLLENRKSKTRTQVQCIVRTHSCQIEDREMSGDVRWLPFSNWQSECEFVQHPCSCHWLPWKWLQFVAMKYGMPRRHVFLRAVNFDLCFEWLTTLARRSTRVQPRSICISETNNKATNRWWVRLWNCKCGWNAVLLNENDPVKSMCRIGNAENLDSA